MWLNPIFFFQAESSLKLFFITHTFDSGGFFTFLLDLAHGAPWASVVNLVKKPALIVNATYLELNDFNTSMWFSWCPTDPKKLQSIEQCIQIHQVCVSKHHRYDINISSLRFLYIFDRSGLLCAAALLIRSRTLDCSIRMYYDNNHS